METVGKVLAWLARKLLREDTSTRVDKSVTINMAPHSNVNFGENSEGNRVIYIKGVAEITPGEGFRISNDLPISNGNDNMGED